MRCEDCGEQFDPEKGNPELCVCEGCKEDYWPCIVCDKQVKVRDAMARVFKDSFGSEVICEQCQTVEGG
mgnify:FL=1